jgi:hypothetical protein
MPHASHGQANPIFLISTMAMHTQNLLADPRFSLLVTPPDAGGDPLGASRVTLLGNMLPIPESDVAGARKLYITYMFAVSLLFYRESHSSWARVALGGEAWAAELFIYGLDLIANRYGQRREKSARLLRVTQIVLLKVRENQPLLRSARGHVKHAEFLIDSAVALAEVRGKIIVCSGGYKNCIELQPFRLVYRY